MRLSLFGVRYKDGKDGRRVFKVSDKIYRIINTQDWTTIWDALKDIYPNLVGRVDFVKVYEGILDALPELEEGTIIDEDDFGRLADATASSLMGILKVYDRIYRNNGVGEITS